MRSCETTLWMLRIANYRDMLLNKLKAGSLAGAAAPQSVTGVTNMLLQSYQEVWIESKWVDNLTLALTSACDM